MGNLWNTFGPGYAQRPQPQAPARGGTVNIGQTASSNPGVDPLIFLKTALGADVGNVITAQLKGVGDQIKSQLQTVGPQILIGALLVVVMIFAAYMFLKD